MLLEHPNIASTVMNGKQHKGTWTMIYDEGFEVELAGTKFFAFHKFSKDSGKEYSHCDKTYPGWYHPAKNLDAKKWGCYHGIKETTVRPSPPATGEPPHALALHYSRATLGFFSGSGSRLSEIRKAAHFG